MDEMMKKPAETDKKAPKPIPIANAKKWRDKIRRSEKVRKPFKEDLDKFFRMYQGDYNPQPRRNRRDYDRMSVNLVFAHIETITPSIFSGFPYIRVKPKPKVGEAVENALSRARNMELVINYWFKELAVDDELKDVLFDSFFSWAGVELGWETEVETKKEVFTNEYGVEEEKSELIVLKDEPFIMRRDPLCFYFDPDAKRRRDCRWIGVEEIMHYNDFLASPKYTEKAKDKVKPQIYPIDAETKNWMGRDEDTSGKEWVKIITIWDKDTRKVFAVTDGYDGFLNSDDPEGQEWPYVTEYKKDPYPFAILDAKRDRMSPYTWSEFKAAEAQILEINRIRSAIQIHVKRCIPKFIYTDAAGTRGDIAKLMNARSDEATKLNNLDAIRPFDSGPIPAPLFEFNSMSKEDLKVIQGTTQYEASSLSDTATEANIIEGRDRARKGYRSKMWEQFVVEIAAKLAMLCQQNMSRELAVEIAGPEGTEWMNVNKDQIQGEFFFDIEPGTMEYKNEALRKQQLLKFMELTNGDVNVNRRGLIEKVAKELDLDSEGLVLPQDQIPPPPAPEPNIQFKDIDPALITDPTVMNAVVKAAMEQNGIVVPNMPQEPQSPMAPEPGIPKMSGKDFAGLGMNPQGNPELPPVEGNITETGSL